MMYCRVCASCSLPAGRAPIPLEMASTCKSAISPAAVNSFGLGVIVESCCVGSCVASIVGTDMGISLKMAVGSAVGAEHESRINITNKVMKNFAIGTPLQY